MEQNQLSKLTHSVYGILDTLPDGDPLKNRGKEAALAILESATKLNRVEGWVSLKNLLSPESQKMLAVLLAEIEVLEQYLLIGKNQGWISNMNFLIISREYNEIKKSIPAPVGLPVQLPVAGSHAPVSTPLEVEETKESLPSKKVALVKKNRQDEVAIQQESAIVSDKASARKKRILDILDEKEKAQVSDIVARIPNITKRTIRRDLDELLKTGKVIRAGEWNQVFYQKSVRT